MSNKTDLKIAFLGMGIMGSSMAVNLCRKGYQVKVWNRTKDKPETRRAVDSGCTSASSLQEAVADADVVMTCLGDVSDVEEVLIGVNSVASHARSGVYVVDFSTIGPRAACQIADALAKSGQFFLDAPITGGDVGAKNGTLTIMVGGKKEHFEKLLPVLECVGSSVELCGEAGSGQALKLCNQVLCAVTMSAVSEAIHLARNLEIDPELVVRVLKDGAGGSWALSNLGARIIKDDLKPGFMLKHMLKDLRLVNENKRGESVDLPAMEMAEAMFKKLVEEDSDNLEAFGTQAMIKVYEK